MEANDALFTIITASYNSEKSIRRTIDSILSQTMDNLEYIIIDGASSDGTIEIFKSYEKEFKDKQISYRWISEPDQGIYDAWNKGLNMANGTWISFLGSDDIYLSAALEAYYGAIKNYFSETVPHLVYSNVDYMDGSKKMMTLNGTWSWKNFQKYMCIAHVGSFHNRAYFETYGKFDESYKICGDYELLLRAKDRLRTSKVEKITAHMQAGGISNHLVDKAFKETYRAKITSGGVPKLIAKWDFYLAHLKHFIKKFMRRR